LFLQVLCSLFLGIAVGLAFHDFSLALKPLGDGFISLIKMLIAQGQVAGIMVTGIDPKYEKNVSIIQNHIVAGSLDSLKKGEFG
uniref:cation:dicarboxylate symporter family transporter n=1 Tax=Acinetobacter nosocomialis TaxID=106654 RepID=UPI0035A239C2